MALKMLGKDSTCDDDNCPAVFDNGETYVIQGWRVTDPSVLAQLGVVPDGETVLEIPKRLVQFFPEVTGER
ncbi:hypothetical protein [Catellatospora paridis]|uniref:hypothetical protein n=1 Tax=Catellatospora paridis TaxID=1617086 RepID=UPI0012D46B13|nr:hypothetical protein [Catellatospora paridis]